MGMTPRSSDARSFGSKDKNEGETQAGVIGSTGGSAASMSHRVLSRKNESNMGPEAKSPVTLGSEQENFGLPVYSAGQRHTGRRS